LILPCYLTTFSGKKCLSGKFICAFFVPLIEVLLYLNYPVDNTKNLSANLIFPYAGFFWPR
jgi:hypothetical protein